MCRKVKICICGLAHGPCRVQCGPGWRHRDFGVLKTADGAMQCGAQFLRKVQGGVVRGEIAGAWVDPPSPWGAPSALCLSLFFALPSSSLSRAVLNSFNSPFLQPKAKPTVFVDGARITGGTNFSDYFPPFPFPNAIKSRSSLFPTNRRSEFLSAASFWKWKEILFSHSGHHLMFRILSCISIFALLVFADGVGELCTKKKTILPYPFHRDRLV